MKRLYKSSSLLLLVISLIIVVASPTMVLAATDPGLGAAATFSIIAQTAITRTGTISGDVGINSTGAGITALTAGDVGGTIYSTDGVAPGLAILNPAVQANLSTANDNISGQGLTGSIGPALDGLSLTTGVYNIGAGRLNGGVLTLNGPGTYIFRASSDFVSSGSINFTNGARACDLYWQVSTLATINGSSFAGTIIAGTGVHFGDGVALDGRALALGGDVTLLNNTISGPTCAAAPATLRIIKTVINNNGGTAVAAGFNLHVKLSGTDVAGSPAVGTVAPGTSYSLSAGTYVVSEDANAAYTQSFSGDCDASGNIILSSGDDKTCTVTNDDIAVVPATLRIIKTVINNNGGTAVAADFTLDVAGTNVSNPSFAGSEAGVDVTLDAGAYAVTETSLSGYLQSGSGDCSGTIAAGETKTCTITNDDIAPQLIVNKVVINDNGGTKVISDFPLFISLSAVTSGVATTTTIGLHTVSETAAAGYAAVIGGDCAADGTVTLALGDVKTCTITNDDIAVVPPSSSGGGSYYVPVPPLIAVVKVPSPLALPAGPGPVTYTYTLVNIGTVPVAQITMVGDTCSPIILISGDTNADARLDVNETWVYTCSTMLSKTHTNIITATGWANGISTNDIASATVIVGISVVPPLIHVTKIPNPLTLPAAGGRVTYTKKITNPGTVALSNVRATDDKCSPIKYISGDTNNDAKLDPTETWIYKCSVNLDKTTTNTAIASATANGLTVRDFAIATVVVAAPGFPNAGLPLQEQTAEDGLTLASLLLLISSSLLVLIGRKRMV